jgi:hypothetical protein
MYVDDISSGGNGGCGDFFGCDGNSMSSLWNDNGDLTTNWILPVPNSEGMSDENATEPSDLISCPQSQTLKNMALVAFDTVASCPNISTLEDLCTSALAGLTSSPNAQTLYQDLQSPSSSPLPSFPKQSTQESEVRPLPLAENPDKFYENRFTPPSSMELQQR